MDPKPLISVILPVYNQEEYVSETIQSVLRQTYPHFELLIMDDGSADNSARIIRELAQTDNRIRAYFGPNQGKNKAINALVEMASASWCAFIDGDDVMLPNRLENQLTFHLHNPLVDASSSNCIYINKNGKEFGNQTFSYSTSIEEARNILRENRIIHCAFTALMVSTCSFRAAGGMSAHYWRCGDFEFINRYVEKGFLFINLQATLMKYRLHSDSVSARKPLEGFEMIGFITENILRRRSGRGELSLPAFQEMRKGESIFTKLGRRRFHLAQIYFRRAGIQWIAGNYLMFGISILLSFTCSPRYVFQKFRNIQVNHPNA